MYKKDSHVHFMGIGGIGMSGIAAILRLQGYRVSGCDIATNSSVIEWLKELGCTVYADHHADHVVDADVIVYSSAISSDHLEIQAALKKGIPVIPRAIMLAELMRMKYGVAIAGSHGKTTTTSMISHILTEAGLDPTIVIGGVLKNLSTHARLGNGDLLIAEADESDRSLLYLNPSIAIVTNIDAEHLDTYTDLEDVKETFKNFLGRLPFFGKALICIDDHNLRSILPLPHIPAIKYGLSKEAQVRGEILALEPRYSLFRVYKRNTGDGPERLLGEVVLHMPGEHNVLNALGAIALSLELELDFNCIKRALDSFKGVERRFEFKGICQGAEIFDDYGHHPTEIEKTLLIAKRRAKDKLHVVFQPHRYSRTQKLWREFIDVFACSQIDTLFLTDIYPASEAPIPDVTSRRLVRELQARCPHVVVHYYPGYAQIAQHAKQMLRDGDLFITIGAGKANCIGKMLLEDNIPV